MSSTHPGLVVAAKVQEEPVVQSWCHTRDKSMKFSHLWSIDNFSFRNEETGSVIRSAPFTTWTDQKMQWCLQVYPRGDREENKAYVSIFLQLMSCTGRASEHWHKLKVKDSSRSEISVKAKFVIINANDQEAQTRETEVKRYTPGFSCGFSQFVGRDSLLNRGNQHLRNDRLTIRCDAHVVTGSVDIFGPNDSTRVEVAECRLSQQLGSLFESGKLTDVSFVVQGQTVRAHRSILAARSNVFAAMFECEMKEKKEGSVQIDDIDPQVFREMLRFIYTGTAPNLDSLATELLSVADKYDLERLKNICEACLSSKCSTEIAVELLLLADAHNAKQLKAKVIEYMSTYPTDIVQTDTWKTLTADQPHVLMDAFKALAIQYAGPLSPPQNGSQ